MSREEAQSMGTEPPGPRRRRTHLLAALAVLTLATGAVACGGDDDDAAESTDALDTAADAATSLPSEITEPAGSTDAPESGSTPGSDPAEDSAPASAPDAATVGTAATTADINPTDAAAEVAGSDASETGTAAPAAAAAVTTAAGTTASDGTTDVTTGGSTLDVGPTTTGPACVFEENTSLPLERCDQGPAVAVVQQFLQLAGYSVGIDGEFGDQTLYAVRAFQESEGLQVDGIVGLETWNALGIGEESGTDTDGDGVVEPDELDLTG